MPVVTMWIEKFGREVLIDDDHPLAVAQLARGAAEAESDTEPRWTPPQGQEATDSADAREDSPGGLSTADTPQAPAPPAPVVPARDPRPHGKHGKRRY